SATISLSSKSRPISSLYRFARLCLATGSISKAIHRQPRKDAPMKSTSRLALALTAFLATSSLAAAQQCGGDLGAFLEGVKAEAVAAGASSEAAEAALAGAQIDQKVLSRDRSQGVFKQTFLEFSQRTVSQSRLDIGRQKIKQYAEVFGRAEQEYGVPAGVIAAFWAMETDFGVVQGDFNTRNALVTLAHDCRRPELFRPQLLNLITMVQ